MSKTATPVPRLLSLADLEEMTGASRKAILGWVKAGRFPKPVPIGIGKLWWNREAVERVLQGAPAEGASQRK